MNQVKITLRELGEQDIPFMIQLYGDQVNMKFLKHRTDPDELMASVRAILDRSMDPEIPDISFVVVNMENLQPMAVTGIQWSLNSEVDVEIGIVVDHAWHRKGVGHQAKSAIMDMAFKKYNAESVNAFCGLDNVPANQANVKLGFNLHGTIHHHYLDTTANHWKITKEEYLCRKKKAV
jgi:RimJ/RimL family protein N-acetyltransferase